MAKSVFRIFLFGPITHMAKYLETTTTEFRFEHPKATAPPNLCFFHLFFNDFHCFSMIFMLLAGGLHVL